MGKDVAIQAKVDGQLPERVAKTPLIKRMSVKSFPNPPALEDHTNLDSSVDESICRARDSAFGWHRASERKSHLGCFSIHGPEDLSRTREV